MNFNNDALLEKLADKSTDIKLKTIYDWIKQNHITLKQFKELIKQMDISEAIEIEIPRRIDRYLPKSRDDIWTTTQEDDDNVDFNRWFEGQMD